MGKKISLLRKLLISPLRFIFKPVDSLKERNLKLVGTKYGGWVIPDSGFLNDKSIIYAVGAGEDISFDVGVVQEYGSEVHIFDPTPRAKEHYDYLVYGIKSGKDVLINGGPEKYSISEDQLSSIFFHQIGLWNEKDSLKFFVPRNSSHVSHSLLNLQQTDDYIMVDVDCLRNIMQELDHTKIDLLKLDIEGAEYKVLESIIEDNIDVRVLCIEFDEVNNPLDDMYRNRIDEILKRITDFGYKIVFDDGGCNYTLVK